MQAIRISDLTFKYPDAEKAALEGVSMDIAAGEFICLCGRTGSGKTTLMRCLKPELAPHGRLEGRIEVFGKEIVSGMNGNYRSVIPAREAAMRIGYVMQNPDNQIVTDKVWHELAFGLENTGMDPERIRVRVAEMATFFGIHNWFDRETDRLSGGQKQMLNLAAVMAMQPDILLLDEPTASLDPLAATDFLGAVRRISREIGTTILICEHRLDEVVPMADRLVVLDKGRMCADGLPEKVAGELIAGGHEMGKAMPAPLKAYLLSVNMLDDATNGLKSEISAPLDVGSGRRWLAGIAAEKSIAAGESSDRACDLADETEKGTPAAIIKDAWFRYEKDGADVLRGLSLTINKGEIVCLLGGNGAGKSTVMKMLAAETKPYRGKVRFMADTVSMLPQNPQLLFTEDTVLADLKEVIKCAEKNSSYTEEQESEGESEDIGMICSEMRLAELLCKHPYDLSGGEQQRAALAKVMLTDADVMLLDEPTKGLDEGFKEELTEILKRVAAGGKCIVVTSHDVDFCARVADRCAMVFDGQINGEGRTRDFFTGNGFYTTPCERMSRGILDGTLFPEEIARSVRG